MGFDKLIRRASKLGEAVMIRHTLFSLPFAVAAVLLETAGKPSVEKLFWIIVAAAGARNAANALNRLIDLKIDAKNPRTAARPSVTGEASFKALVWLSIAGFALVILGAAMLNPLCVALLPLAGILVFGYSYTKRFTWLCHYWLGVACSAATMGAFLGISGAFHVRYFPLVGGVALWVAGFDILYAIQDIEFDRRESLFSVPAAFGEKGARIIAATSHLGAAAGMGSAFFLWPLHPLPFLAAFALCVILLAAEHVIALGKTDRHIRIAAYGINEILPFVFLFGVASSIYIG